MKLNRLLLLSLAALAALTARADTNASPAAADHPEVRGAVRLFEAWLDGQIAYRGLPGVAVGVVHDQQLVWARGFGFADIEQKLPVTPATKFRIASHSKLFTATAILQLREAGKLRLDDTVVQHLPWFTLQPGQKIGSGRNLLNLFRDCLAKDSKDAKGWPVYYATASSRGVISASFLPRRALASRRSHSSWMRIQ